MKIFFVYQPLDIMSRMDDIINKYQGKTFELWIRFTGKGGFWTGRTFNYLWLAAGFEYQSQLELEIMTKHQSRKKMLAELALATEYRKIEWRKLITEFIEKGADNTVDGDIFSVVLSWVCTDHGKVFNAFWTQDPTKKDINLIVEMDVNKLEEIEIVVVPAEDLKDTLEYLEKHKRDSITDLVLYKI
jgi:hypothetical protein